MYDSDETTTFNINLDSVKLTQLKFSVKQE